MASQDLTHQLVNQLILQSNAKLIAPCAGPPSGIGKANVFQQSRQQELDRMGRDSYNSRLHTFNISRLNNQRQKSIRGASLNAIHATPALNAKAEPKLQHSVYLNGLKPTTTVRNQPEDIVCTGTAHRPGATKYQSVPASQ